MTDTDTTDMLGGLDINSSREVSVPDKLIDQVIGQEEARELVENAAEQGRHVMMIGSPGTGKSMLAKAMSQLLPSDDLKDILVYPNPDDENNPKIRTVPAGKGEQIIEAHKQEEEKKNKFRNLFMWGLIIAILGYAILVAGKVLMGFLVAGIFYLAFNYFSGNGEESHPTLLVDNSDKETAPFEDATGAHDGALLGDVRHDPYQSGQMATPPHQRVEAGAIHKGHDGVVFVDEINTLDVRSQQKLMTAIEEGEFQITGQSENSSGAMVQTEPAPTDFQIVAAGNMDAMENMHPALRSRIRGDGYEIHMDETVEDDNEMRQKFVQFVAQEVERDGEIPHFDEEAIEEVIREAQRMAGQKGKLTLELRELGGLVRVAGDLAKANGHDLVQKQDVLDAKDRSKSIEEQVADKHIERKKEYDMSSIEGTKIGYVNGLAVTGSNAGNVLPLAVSISPAQGAGEVIATGKVKEIAQESIQNVSSIIKDLSDESLDDHDIHVQFLQTYPEGVDGDSASVTVATGIISAFAGVPIKQNVAMTGSLTVRGDVLPVGGVTHKVEAAAKQGLDTVVIPAANEQDLQLEDKFKDEIEVVTAETISDVLEVAFDADDEWLDAISKEITRKKTEGVGEIQVEATPSV